jgi:hypothetical protein
MHNRSDGGNSVFYLQEILLPQPDVTGTAGPICMHNADVLSTEKLPPKKIIEMVDFLMGVNSLSKETKRKKSLPMTISA